MNLSGDNDDVSGSEVLTEEEVKAAMLFFRTCVVNRDREQLKIRLKQTIRAREVLIKTKGTKFHQLFPFYFIDPMLVCFSDLCEKYLSLIQITHSQILFDFEIRSPDINSNALLEVWPTLKSDVIRELSLCDRDECANYFDKEIGFFIALLKLLSVKNRFEEKVDAFIIFTDVCAYFILNP